MGHRAFLVSNNTGIAASSEYEDPGIILVAKSTIPVFWFSLFSADDLRTYPVELDGGEKADVCGLIVEVRTGLNRSLARERVLFKYLPTELSVYFEKWRNTIKEVTSPYILLDPSDFIGVGEPEELRMWLLQSIAAFDSGRPEDLSVLFDHTSLDFDAERMTVAVFEPATLEYDLMGFTW